MSPAPLLCPLRGSRGWESELARLGPLNVSQAARDVGKAGDPPTVARASPSLELRPQMTAGSCASQGSARGPQLLPGQRANTRFALLTLTFRAPTGHRLTAASPGAWVRLPATYDLSECQPASAPGSLAPCAPPTGTEC